MSEENYGSVGSPMRQQHIEDQILALQQSNENAEVQPLRYYALLDQTGPTAPDVTILKNTLGAVPAWDRTSTGIYTLTLVGAFDNIRTAISITGDQAGSIYTAIVTDEDTITLTTGEYLGGDFILEDELMNKATFKVEVYPIPSI